ncbi:EAL and HDOD domain-containing protein [Bacillus xiapuensis]|uniref:EAL and HDOD domain-containing protein n=1 Tax=Bacillus xiapuensis TaxID=2014075 RepID=UPI000C240ABB|nr:HDOD domain-containing protein [Bacillus xiapuensis]
MTVYVARQPIFNRKEETVAYELLYRKQDNQPYADIMSGDEATMEVLKNGLLNIGIDRLSDGKMLFVNFTKNLLLQDVPSFLANDQIVIEILEDIHSTKEVIQAGFKLKEAGFKLALDDFLLNDQNKDLVPLADIIKVDFMQTTKEQRQEMRRAIENPKVLWLAEKVESRSQFTEALEEDFHLFQGFFFEKPSLISADAIPEFSKNYFLIMDEIASPAPDIKKVARLIEEDLSLSYQLLKLLNKTAFIQREKVQTIHQAVMLIGLEELKKWLLFIILNISGSKCPEEIIRTSLIRAKTLEQLAHQYFPDELSSKYFLLGMLSMVDALIARPMEEILRELPIDTEVKKALILKKNSLAEVLQLTRDLEGGNWDAAIKRSLSLHIDDRFLLSCYHEAIRWSSLILQK